MKWRKVSFIYAIIYARTRLASGRSYGGPLPHRPITSGDSDVRLTGHRPAVVVFEDGTVLAAYSDFEGQFSDGKVESHPPCFWIGEPDK